MRPPSGSRMIIERLPHGMSGVDERTVRRYVGHLLDLDVPVESAALQPDTAVAVEKATAKVQRVLPRSLAITYRDKNDRSTERVLEPYGVDALRGRWYATGLDSRSGQVRSFRLDRVAHAAVQGSERVVRMRMPGPIARMEQINGEPGWVRVRWRVERLDWVPSVLAGLDRPFVIEEPNELRERVRALAGQLASWAGAADRNDLPGPAPPAHQLPRPG
jgi:WYL domain